MDWHYAPAWDQQMMGSEVSVPTLRVHSVYRAHVSIEAMDVLSLYLSLHET